MAYKQSPMSVLKGQMKNKAVGLAHGDSMAMQTDPKTGKKLDEFGNPIPEGFKSDTEEFVATPRKMYERDVKMYDPGTPKLEKGISGRYQFRTESGGVDPFPSKAFTIGLGEDSLQGAPGRSFTQEEAEKIKSRYKKYIAPKTKAKSWLSKNT